MKEQISLPSAVQKILSRLEENGYEAFAVGGCVRDALCGKVPHDWDLCTNALPTQIQACFPDCTTLTVGEKHGTITILWEHEPYEVTTYRTEGTYTDHRRPDEVQFVRNLKEDLQRRDFTINAMAYHPKQGIIDLFGGISDLQAKKIRCVGTPEKRFSEDALRILRGLRFAATYEMEIDAETASAIIRLTPLLAHIAVERIDVEFCKLLTAPAESTAKVLRAFTPVWTFLFPEILPSVGFPQNHPRHRYDVWEHSLHVLEATPPNLYLRWAALLHDIGKPHTCTTDDSGVNHFLGHAAVSKQLAHQILHRLHADSKRISAVCTRIEYHDTPLPTSRKGMRRLMAKLDADTVKDLILLRRADSIGQSPEAIAMDQPKIDVAEELRKAVLADEDCLHIKDLKIDGHDILALGIEKGPRIGVILTDLFQMVLEAQIANDRTALLEQAKLMLPQHSVPADPTPNNNDSDTHDKTPETFHRPL